MGFEWTSDKVETLKVLWHGGMSGSEIAFRLDPKGSVTRCSVIGKVHRLGLPRRAKQPVMTDLQKQVRRERKARRVQENSSLFSYDITPVIKFPKAPEKMLSPPNSKHVTLVDRTGCCWPVNDGGPFLFCNAEQHGKSPYCEFHYRKSIKVREEA